ncbi:hypothetical protein M2427_008028 [Bradyrhizobium sp. BR13661]|jgi:hypothetical protein|nr:hypothetical protein [Bradyrhizobium sp. BR13661]
MVARMAWAACIVDSAVNWVELVLSAAPACTTQSQLRQAIYRRNDGSSESQDIGDRTMATPFLQGARD